MNGDSTTGPEDPVLRDDELLDALRRGTPPPPDDPVAAMLAGWHTEIETRAARLETAPCPVPDGTRPATPTGRSGLDGDAGGPTDRTDHGSSGSAAGLRRPRPGTGRTRRRKVRLLSGAALTIATMAGGVWLGAAHAEPDGLLWPVTELVWTERAESVVTEREIDRLLDQARRDLVAGRYTQARAGLDRAATLLTRLGDDQRADRLRTDLDDLRKRLPAPAGPASHTPPANLPGAPATPPAAGQPVGEPAPATSSPVVPADEGSAATLPTSPVTPGRPGHPAPPTTAPATATPVSEAGRPATNPGSGAGRPAKPDRPAVGPGRPADSPATDRGRPTTNAPAPTGGGGAAAITDTVPERSTPPPPPGDSAGAVTGERRTTTAPAADPPDA
ncbi:hypothetical protein ACL02O_30705 [Micromonospora sp. MS34]|uniref:hypothetical protein n=1 Tax=Micromonospora sp. MS34 TaxID=3385971 RepID=UPI0039A14E0E